MRSTTAGFFYAGLILLDDRWGVLGTRGERKGQYFLRLGMCNWVVIRRG